MTSVFAVISAQILLSVPANSEVAANSFDSHLVSVHYCVLSLPGDGGESCQVHAWQEERVEISGSHPALESIGTLRFAIFYLADFCSLILPL